MIRNHVTLGDAEYVVYVDKGSPRRVHRVRSDNHGGTMQVKLDIHGATARRVIAEWQSSPAAKPRDALSVLWDRSA